MRKIYFDMDCFYAAIEERDNPALMGKPVGVGGSSRRGVLTTANYEARKFSCRSAMPVFMALEKCQELLIVPTRFDVYIRDSQRIQEIFARFTPLVEPLSLDEAFLDVSHHAEPAMFVASRIHSHRRGNLLPYLTTTLMARSSASTKRDVDFEIAVEGEHGGWVQASWRRRAANRRI